MIPEIEEVLDCILHGENASSEAMQGAIGALMDGRCSEVEIASLLTALRVKEESTDEIAGAAMAMGARATKISSSRTGLLDTCGTGGDQLHTFNISTASALVAAAAGVPVAKHGNRSVSSCSGSADVLETLGVNVQLAPDRVGACIDEIGLGFCFAPLFHEAMRHAISVRRQLKFRTIFNLLGPLTNPAGAEFQLLGANSTAMAEKLAGAAARLKRRKVLVVCGADELDEVSLWGETTVFEVVGDAVTQYTWTAEEFGLAPCTVDQIRVESPQESADRIARVLQGEPGPARDIVLANTAAALIAAERASEPKMAAALAAEAVDSGVANGLLRRLIEFTGA